MTEDKTEQTRERRKRRNLWQFLFDLIWGYDYFISYRRSDGSEYSKSLFDRLTANTRNCFLDADRTDGFQLGENIDDKTRRALRKTTYLILIATKDTLGDNRLPDADPIYKELRLFKDYNRRKSHRRIVRIDLPRRKGKDEWDDLVKHSKLSDFFHKDERFLHEDDEQALTPSESTVNDLIAMPGSDKRSRRKVTILKTAMWFFFILSLFASFVAWLAYDSFKEARKQQYFTGIQAAAAEIGRGEYDQARNRLIELPKRERYWEWAYLLEQTGFPVLKFPGSDFDVGFSNDPEIRSELSAMIETAEDTSSLVKPVGHDSEIKQMHLANDPDVNLILISGGYSKKIETYFGPSVVALSNRSKYFETKNLTTGKVASDLYLSHPEFLQSFSTKHYKSESNYGTIHRIALSTDESMLLIEASDEVIPMPDIGMVEKPGFPTHTNPYIAEAARLNLIPPESPRALYLLPLVPSREDFRRDPSFEINNPQQVRKQVIAEANSYLEIIKEPRLSEIQGLVPESAVLLDFVDTFDKNTLVLKLETGQPYAAEVLLLLRSDKNGTPPGNRPVSVGRIGIPLLTADDEPERYFTCGGALSRDGKWALVSPVRSSDGNEAIGIFNLTDTDTYHLFEKNDFPELFPSPEEVSSQEWQLSPNGKWFVKGTVIGEANTSEIHCHLVDIEKRKVHDQSGISKGSKFAGAYSWSPDSNTLFFNPGDTALMAISPVDFKLKHVIHDFMPWGQQHIDKSFGAYSTIQPRKQRRYTIENLVFEWGSDTPFLRLEKGVRFPTHLESPLLDAWRGQRNREDLPTHGQKLLLDYINYKDSTKRAGFLEKGLTLIEDLIRRPQENEFQPVQYVIDPNSNGSGLDTIGVPAPFTGTGDVLETPEGIPIKVIARIETSLLDEPSEGSTSRPVSTFEIFYALRPVDGSPEKTMNGFYRVGATESASDHMGWIRASHVVEWPHRQALGIIPASTREEVPAKFYETKEKLTQSYSGTDIEPFSQEPENSVGVRLLPILEKFKMTADGDPVHGYQIAYMHENNGMQVNLLRSKIDVVFVIDTTVSMYPWIDGTRRLVERLSKELHARKGEHEVRFGLVGYRDNLPDAPDDWYVSKVFATLDEGADFERFLEIISDVEQAEVSSGEDREEDVLAGLQLAIDRNNEYMGWRPNSLKHIILVGDAAVELDQNEGNQTIESVIRLAQPPESIDAIQLARMIHSIPLEDPSRKATQEFKNRTKNEFQRLSSGGYHQGLSLYLERDKKPEAYIDIWVDGILGWTDWLKRKKAEKRGDMALDFVEKETQGSIFGESYFLQMVRASGEASNMPSFASGFACELDENGNRQFEPRILVNKGRLSLVYAAIQEIVEKLDHARTEGNHDLRQILADLQLTTMGLNLDTELSEGTSLSEIYELLAGIPVKSGIFNLTIQDVTNMTQTDYESWFADVRESIIKMNNALSSQDTWRSLDQQSPADDDRKKVGFVPIRDLP